MLVTVTILAEALKEWLLQVKKKDAYINEPLFGHKYIYIYIKYIFKKGRQG